MRALNSILESGFAGGFCLSTKQRGLGKAGGSEDSMQDNGRTGRNTW